METWKCKFDDENCVPMYPNKCNAVCEEAFAKGHSHKKPKWKCKYFDECQPVYLEDCSKICEKQGALSLRDEAKHVKMPIPSEDGEKIGTATDWFKAGETLGKALKENRELKEELEKLKKNGADVDMSLSLDKLMKENARLKYENEKLQEDVESWREEVNELRQLRGLGRRLEL